VTGEKGFLLRAHGRAPLHRVVCLRLPPHLPSVGRAFLPAIAGGLESPPHRGEDFAPIGVKTRLHIFSQTLVSRRDNQIIARQFIAG
jgi:hypothetical protein